MLDCRYCAHRNGGHDSKCLELAEVGSTEQKQAQEPAEAAYHLGYGRGEVGLEEAENGCKSWAG